MRPLFLGWLSDLYIGDEDNDAPIPPIPEGLEKLTRTQKRLTQYLRVDGDILAAAAERSTPAQPPTMSLAQWIRRLPEDQKDSFIEKTISEGDPAAVASMRGRYQLESAAPKGQVERGSLRIGTLLASARNIKQEREAGVRGKPRKRKP